jgi:outer membrane receptor protein involved in Fe transport
MKISRAAHVALLLTASCIIPAVARSQQAAEPAPPAAGGQLPEVEVIQKKKTATPAAPKKQTVTKQAPTPQPVAEPATLPEGQEPVEQMGAPPNTVQMSPLPGSEIPISKVPAGVGHASQADIQRTGDVQAPDVLQRTVPGVILSDAQGNVFQRTLQYRGYDASPLNGAAQGIAVYQNGVRINEAFGDIVNWDFLPSNAISGITLIGANPVFGLNAIGGAATIAMRDGFNFQGTEIDTRAGSFGRIQGSLATGARSGIWGAFVALEGIRDDGFRDYSESEVRRMYADIGVKTSEAEFHLNFTGAKNEVGVTAAAPVQLLDLGWDKTFTSPQTTDNEMAMVSLNGAVKASDTLSFSGVTYYRKFKQKHVDGNIAEAEDCPGPGGTTVVCAESEDGGSPEPFTDRNGNTLPFDEDLVYGSIDRTSQDANGYGGSLQAVEKTPLFGLPNQFLIGSSYDHGTVKYTANSELGFFAPNFVVKSFDPAFMIGGPDDFVPRALDTKNDYVGVYFSDTIDLTSRLALTVGGRYNYARIELDNQGEIEDGEEDKLTGTHTYERFNPMAGLTYQLARGLTLYGSYAEANRAPTAAELACADPEAPCLIESFLTADPPLKQVVSKTFELGLRGELVSLSQTQHLNWTFGLFHATNEDDIIPVTSAVSQGRGFFQNAGETQRQGIEAGVQYQETRWSAYANYALVDATFRTPLVLSSPNSPNSAAFECPDSDDALCIQVNKGDHLPGIPMHRFKAGIDYWITSKWRLGADLTASSDQVFFGDEGNDGKRLGGYAKVDMHTSYDLTDHIQIYGLVDNVFDTRYGLFGNYFDRELANAAGTVSGLDDEFFTDARTITPAPPVTAYGGVKFRF